MSGNVVAHPALLRERRLSALGQGPGITWYDVLGLLPGASAEQVQRQHDAKASLLRPELIAGAPSPVVAAASRARDILGAAHRVLTDPVNRARYDEAVGIRRSGGRLAPPGNFPAQPEAGLADVPFLEGDAGLEMLGALLVLADSMTSHPRPPGRVVVPDVQGLFYGVCLGITGKLGFRVTTVRLTDHPMPVEGLVVGQSPRPAARARRGSALTVQVWHPPVRHREKARYQD
jgi:curved DNA-binding protein CbpA